MINDKELISLPRGVFVTRVTNITHNPRIYIAVGGVGVKKFHATKNLMFVSVAY